MSSWLSWMFFFFKQKTAYEMRISDWSSDVCSSDLPLCCRLSGRTGCTAWPVSTDCKARKLHMPHWLTLIDPKLLQVLALALLALAILLVGATMLWHAMGQDRRRVAVHKELLKPGRVSREARAQDAESGQASGRIGSWAAAAAHLGTRGKAGDR